MVRTFTLQAHRHGFDLERDLNDQQRAVATAAGGPMLVIAGAGTGKTRALTYRLAMLLARGATPSGMLLMTFTNRAAREMIHRVELLVEHEARRVWAGTFHHVANRILREHGAVMGLSPEFTILDREDAADLVAASVVDVGVRIERKRFPGKAVLGSMASALANTMTSLPVLLPARYPMFTGHLETIDRVLRRYRERKRERSLLDYDDLLGEWWRLLRDHPDVADRLANRFEHILVDEYQDTNLLQARIVDRLAAVHRNLCVVGDDSQSIYSFRGADCTNMLAFGRRYPDAVEHRLETNYRSTPQILDLANESIERNRVRLPKQLRAVRPDGLRPAVVPCGDHLTQSRFIAEYILHLLDEGRELTDIAVLYRSHWHAMEIQLELQRRDIPFSVRGGLRFFEQAHIKDTLAFLRIRHNPADELAWHRVLRLVPRIGGGLAARLFECVSSADDPLAAAASPEAARVLPASARQAFTAFQTVLERLAEIDAPGDMLSEVCDRFYGDYLTSHFANAGARRQDIDGVADFAAQYRTVEAFLSDVALEGDFSGETCEDGPDEQLFVTLSTVHQAKGLEWPVVLIPWVCDGRFPTDLAMGTAAELEEERRVFHVALTRARDELYLVVPQVWSNYRKQRLLMKPSRFLTELGETDLVETMRLDGDETGVTVGASG